MKKTMIVWMAAALVAAVATAPAANSREGATTGKPAVKHPKEISPEVAKGLQWLVQHQLPGGGWGQGEESSGMGGAGTLRDVPNVADTCMAVMALMRSGSTPTKGEYARNIRDGVAFVCEQVKNADEKSLYVTEIRGTRLQSKIGTYVDTFLAAQMLAEVKDAMPDAKAKSETTNCLAKILAKIEGNQKQDGTWAGDGWAPVHSDAIAAKALNRAAAYGAAVDEEVRLRAQESAGGKFDKSSGRFAGGGSAGVDLYAASSTLTSLQEGDNFNDSASAELRQVIAAKPGTPEAKVAQDRLDKFAKNEEALKDSKNAVVKKLDDQQFMAGFGNNGGEEFLSYLNIGESLVVEGGEPWTKWDEKITANLKRIQNGDGSWSGHHCITGRSFCTATSLMVLMVDRMTIPAGGALAKR